MAQPIFTVAILSPKEGKQDKLVEILEKMIPKVQDSELGCLAYQLYTEGKDDGSGDVVMFEKYVDQEALENHLKTPHMKELMHALGEGFVVNGPSIIKNVALKSGFVR